MATIKEAASAFLANRRVAVTGVSREAKGHGSNVVYQRLRERGYEVFAVNPNADEVEGDRCYHDLRSIPGGVEAVVIGTRPEVAEETMRECAELGVRHVWMHRGPSLLMSTPPARSWRSGVEVPVLGNLSGSRLSPALEELLELRPLERYPGGPLAL
jgi:uncharacterized protein